MAWERNRFRTSDLGFREGVPLMRHEYVWGRFIHGRETINLNVQLSDGQFPFDLEFHGRLTINPNVQLPDGQFPFGIKFHGQFPINPNEQLSEGQFPSK
jgi:hypothetical protein